MSAAQRILGYVRRRRIVAVHPPKTWKRRSICGLRLEEPSDWDDLHTALLRNWPSNAPPKDADPELRHSYSNEAEEEGTVSVAFRVSITKVKTRHMILNQTCLQRFFSLDHLRSFF